MYIISSLYNQDRQKEFYKQNIQKNEGTNKTSNKIIKKEQQLKIELSNEDIEKLLLIM
jgi:hypothetical protein